MQNATISDDATTRTMAATGALNALKDWGSGDNNAKKRHAYDLARLVDSSEILEFTQALLEHAFGKNISTPEESGAPGTIDLEYLVLTERATSYAVQWRGQVRAISRTFYRILQMAEEASTDKVGSDASINDEPDNDESGAGASGIAEAGSDQAERNKPLNPIRLCRTFNNKTSPALLQAYSIWDHFHRAIEPEPIHERSSNNTNSNGSGTRISSSSSEGSSDITESWRHAQKALLELKELAQGDNSTETRAAIKQVFSQDNSLRKIDCDTRSKILRAILRGIGLRANMSELVLPHGFTDRCLHRLNESNSGWRVFTSHHIALSDNTTIPITGTIYSLLRAISATRDRAAETAVQKEETLYGFRLSSSYNCSLLYFNYTTAAHLDPDSDSQSNTSISDRSDEDHPRTAYDDESDPQSDSEGSFL